MHLLLSLLLFVAGPQTTPAATKGRAVVAQAVAALGGDHYLQVTQLSGKGHIYSFNSVGEMSGPGTEFWVWNQFPDSERIELTSKRNVTYIYSGGKGWEITFRGIAPLPPKQLASFADTSSHSLDMILKRWAQDPATLILDQGLDTYDLTQVEAVTFTTASGDEATVDFTLDSHLPLRVSWRENDPDTGGHYQESVVYGGWASLGGVQVPFIQDHFAGPQRTGQTYFTAASIAPFPPALFDPSAKIKH